MTDHSLRALERAAASGDPEAANRLAAAWRRAGMAQAVVGDGNGYGNGDGNGHGYGNGNGYGDGNGHGYGNGNGYGNGHGDGNGYGNGNGNGYGYGCGYGDGDGYGDGNGNGYGNGYGYGNGNGEGTRYQVQVTNYIPQGTPGVVRSYVSGVIVGRLVAGESGTILLRDWRWLRRWSLGSGSGSVYDLVQSDKAPTDRGPFRAEVAAFQQSDFMAISEAVYQRLASPEA